MDPSPVSTAAEGHLWGSLPTPPPAPASKLCLVPPCCSLLASALHPTPPGPFRQPPSCQERARPSQPTEETRESPPECPGAILPTWGRGDPSARAEGGADGAPPDHFPHVPPIHLAVWWGQKGSTGPSNRAWALAGSSKPTRPLSPEGWAGVRQDRVKPTLPLSRSTRALAGPAPHAYRATQMTELSPSKRGRCAERRGRKLGVGLSPQSWGSLLEGGQGTTETQQGRLSSAACSHWGTGLVVPGKEGAGGAGGGRAGRRKRHHVPHRTPGSKILATEREQQNHRLCIQGSERVRLCLR